MNMKTLIATSLIVACSLSVPSFAKDDSAKDIISAAKKAQKKAASVGGEWKGVGKFIKKAEEAMKAGKAKKALKLAKKAKRQAEDGYKQAMNQADVAKEFPDYMK